MVNFLWENLFREDKRALSVKSALRENILFSGLTVRELRFVENIIHERHYRAGEVIFRQGEIGVGMYIIVKGRVDISVRDLSLREGDSRDVFVTRLEGTDFFGELSLVEESGRRSATATAAEDSILVGFFKPDLMAILERNPATGVKVVFRLAEVLGRRLRDTTERITQLKTELRSFANPEPSQKGNETSGDSRTNYTP